nr:non-ribosomal peptide synthase/polyketide synthase [Paenibacillus farraposensis]
MKTLIVGGDMLSVPHINRVLRDNPGLGIVNGYGPTENTTFSTTYAIPGELTESVPIGRPICNSTAYVVDSSMKLLPIGAWGELIVGGDGVARGYLNRPELTMEKFVQDPVKPGEICYRTGDLVRWRADGNLEIKGRIDEQVKIRGYRIELGEVEAHLLQVESVQEAVVIAREDQTGQKQLAAYFAADKMLPASELKAALAQELPTYMLPAYFVQVDRLPLTPNGKVDRKALPAPQEIETAGSRHEAPRTPIEASLANIWQEVLGLKSVGIKDNFFDIGGHSLRATLLVSRIHKELNGHIALREVFQFPTIEQMAEIIESRDQAAYASIPVVGERSYYPVSSAQKRLYVLSQIEGGEISYNMPGVMTVEGELDRTRLEAAFRQLIRRHETLRTSFDVVDGEPVQKVHEEVSFAVEYAEVREEEAREHVREFIRPFDLRQAPLLRVGLLRLQKDRHLLLFDMHHIVSDGASMNILVEEFIQLYEGAELPELRIQYKDYAVWQQLEVQSERIGKQEAYWLDTFRGELPVLDLPTDGVRPALQSFEGDQIEFVIDASRSEALKRLAASTGSTLYMVLLSAYTTLLHKYTGQEDVIVGTPIAGRPHGELEGLIGMFVGTLALRNYPSGEKTFLDYLQEVKETSLQAYEHQDYPLEELVAKLNVKRDLSRNPLFDTMFALHNLEQGQREIAGLQFKPYPHEHRSAKFDLMFNVTEQGSELAYSLEYASVLFKRETAERIANHFVQVIDAVANAPETKLSEIAIITATEQAQILEQFNATAADYPKDKTIHQMFEEQVERTPEQTAVVLGESRLTYRELNERANRLARTLRKQGVQADQRVGLMAERSLDMMVGIFAILKAGGAYVPIDPDYPEERIRYMLEDSGAKLLLLQGHLQDRISFAGRTLKLDEAQAYVEDGSNLAPIAGPRDMAYVIYTSGSTGKPKGVMVEHGSVINRLTWMQRVYPFDAGETILQKTAITFDVSVWELFGWSSVGASLCLLPVGGEKDPEVILETIDVQRISRIHFVPAMLNVFLEYIERQGEPAQSKLASLKQVSTSGEALTPIAAARFQQYVAPVSQAKLVNLYGPTEATVEVSYFNLQADETYRTVPIGKPISNIRLYIVSEGGKLQPIGVPGELCIAGDGVARGYLNRPELTAEKFVDDPFVPEERMYRTGDLVRWQADGNIEYLGRIDHQVKIRGYRIELGEVETQLLKVKAVQEAVVVAREDESGQKQMCAYFTANAELTASELRGALAQELPGYMIPSHFVQLEHMPLSPNGKIDRKALPAPESNLSAGTAYVAPRTAVEQALAAVWQGALGVSRVGIYDNFFDLGGDSIKSIQVSSRLLQAGYKMDMKHLFKYPTIAELSPYVQTAERIADQGEVTGETPLLPIQHWFFEQAPVDLHHFNHAVMLYRAEGFELGALRQTMTKIAEHHDALRLVFRQSDRGYEAWNRGISEGELYTLDIADFRGEADCAAAIEAKASDIQRSINLNEGPLLKLGLFHCADGDHLLIVIHHLAVDGVSWRILFEDIATGYEQAASGQEIRLPHKTDSFRTWAQQLPQYAASPAMESEREYWRQIVQTAAATEPLPKDETHDNPTRIEGETVTVQWSEEETSLLLKQANHAYNTEVNDLLLTALGMAVHAWTGTEQVLVSLEGHGREPIIPDTDITRTVGWFTSQYPVVLEVGAEQDVSRSIKRVKEGLRRIPNKGIGYGILTYLSGNGENEDHALRLQPEISFNYLGQFDQDLDSNKLQISPYPVGASMSEKMAQRYTLDINGMISLGVLSLTIDYNGRQYRKETVEKLSDLLRTSLREVILHCADKDQTELTPSDLLLSDLSMEELEQLVQQTAHIGEVENVYKLTSMQKGMLFHSQLEPGSTAYFEQAVFSLQGSLDVDVFVQSLDALVQRHDVLRTSFYSGLAEPVQVVYRHKSCGFYYEDLRELEEAARETYAQAFSVNDMTAGFDLAQDALLRVSVLRTGEQTYRFYWSFHHIIMDGWCVPIMMQEVFEHYAAIQEQREPELSVVLPYSQYIEWLDRQNPEEAATYWSKYLEGYEQQTQLPQEIQENPQSRTEGYVPEEFVCDLGEELTHRMQLISKQYQVTINTLMQTAWGLVLQRYNSSRDVVFGSVVSGRPAEITGIETMIGLFINTIPVRVRADEGAAFADVLKATQEQALASNAYDTYPLYEIQARTEQKQSLISHIMVFENYPMEQQIEQSASTDEDDFEITNVSMFDQTSYDFNLIVIPGEAVRISFRYNSLVYKQASVERMQGHFVHVLEQITANPNLLVSELEVATREEMMQILKQFNATAADYPKDKTIHQMFEEQAERTPEQTAVVFGESRLTYRELNERANRLARTLRAEGVQADQLVGLMAERSLDMMVGIFAILKAGGAYVPIAPDYPEERIRYMLEDSGAKLLLLPSHLQDRISFAGRTLKLDETQAYVKDGSNLAPIAGPRDIAYVIYTSGSTGKPKGVMIEHRSVINRLTWMQEAYPLDAGDMILQKTAITFDVSVWELFWWSFVGASMCLLPVGGEKDPEVIVETIAAQKVSTMHFVPAMLSAFLEHIEHQGESAQSKLASLKQVFASGEALTPNAAARFQQYVAPVSQAKLVNLYGPTEATVDVSYFNLRADETYRTVPIGKPISNIQLYVVSEGGKLQPIGVPGELCIAGDGVGRGYLNRPELTAEKFVDSPFSPGERMYRTGDLVRWQADGNIEYLGRIDHQVKIRGYRIELGEVETQLLKVEAVQETVVVAREDESGQKQMCAYFTANAELTGSELRGALAQELPGYMIPSYFVQLAHMPLSPNGKIDRKALPVPERNLLAGGKYEAPTTPMETRLAQIWKDVLGVGRVGIKDNFFEIGGHSLRATLLIARIQKEMNGLLSLREVFQYPTIAEMAELMASRDQAAYASIPATEERSYYPASSAQKRLYVLSQLEGGEISYNMPGVMMVEGKLDRTRLEAAFRRLISRHETLRTSFDVVNGEPVQRVHEEVPFAVEYAEAREEEAKVRIRDFIRPFDLQQAPLLRAGLIKLQQDRHLLLFDMHHIISDGTSMGVLTEEFIQMYEGSELPELRIQYKDYAVWQQREMQSERIDKQEAYWLDVFRGELPILDLPIDETRPAERSFAGKQVDFVIDAFRSEALKRLAAQSGSTLYMVLLSAYTAFLYKYTGQEDIIVGTPIAGRPHSDLEGLIGMFVGTLALRNYPSGEKTILDYLQEVKETALQAYEHQDYPFEELVAKLNMNRDMSRNPLFDTMFVLQNTEQSEREIAGLQFKPYVYENPTAKFDLTLLIAEQGEELVCSLEYASALFKRETVEQIANHFMQVIDAVVNAPEMKLSEIAIITAAEQAQILEQFNTTAADYPMDKPIHQMFEEQVERTPEQTAMVFGESRLTYRELNDRVNQLAHVLRAEGVRSEQFVGLMVERSLEMVIGIFGILKAGGAYVPIDPEYPEERIHYILKDSGAKLLLTQSHLRREKPDLAGFEGKMVDLDSSQAYAEDRSNPGITVKPKDLMYLIYTSGTTGLPKGTMITQQGLVNYIWWAKKVYVGEEKLDFPLYSSISFDLTLTSIFTPLITGNTIFIYEGADKGTLIQEIIEDNQVDILKLTPTHLSLIKDMKIPDHSRIRKMIVGGENLSTHLAKSISDLFGGNIEIFNEYGPTETVVGCMIYLYDPVRDTKDSVPIGVPADNVYIYLLDSQRNLVPPGVPGEMYIAGDGVALGYLNRPELTAEKFVDNPFAPGGRMYRTGDLARWQADGNIEYLGRIDEQVKIRGYRIELGEVEAQLMKVDAVQEAVVTARADEDGQKYLCAYLVTDRSLTASELRGALAQELPSYMIPSYFVQLERLPYTPNGKIDRKALPVPERSMPTGTAYEAPRTAVEQALTAVWQGVLGVGKIGIRDNFFDLGGDSIKSIQVSSRMLQAGYKLDMKHLFKCPTIAELSPHAQIVGRIADQGEVTGETPLLPIQRWFFEQTPVDPHHYNHAIMLYRAEGFELTALRRTMDKIAEHHDALRLVFRQTDRGYEAWNRGAGEGELYTLDIADFRGEADCASAIEAKASDIQRSINLSEGPLLRLGLFHCADGDHLLIVIHHLAVDGVSWRILFEDIATGYEQAASGQEIRLPHKTDSFRTWAQQLPQYAASPAMESEREYWRQIVQTAAATEPLPKDFVHPVALVRDSETVVAGWSEEETLLLLKQANHAYNTEVNDLLLTALGMAVHAWTGTEQVLVNLEGHGREPIIPDTDITRTVGWFTSQYPVVLEMGAEQDVSRRIKRVKEGLRRIPNKGIGYGILAHLSDDGGNGDDSLQLKPEISFNYLGQFDQDLDSNKLHISPYSTGVAISENSTRNYVLDINGMISEDTLKLAISYCGNHYRKETMEKLAELIQNSLRAIILHCAGKEQSELTPSDLLLSDLSMEELEQLVQQTRHVGEIENVYKLAPMQKGMLFLSLLESNSDSYFEQSTFGIQGSLDIQVFSQSLDALMQRHDALRTNFYNGLAEPVQIVFRNKQGEFYYEDLRGMDQAQRDAYAESFNARDRAKGFDLTQDALLRISILRTGEENYNLIWSFHHIIIDGWCVPLLMQEIFEHYTAILQQRQPELPPVPSYSTYIEWLDRQDAGKAADYWSKYLEDYEQQTLLPQGKAQGKVEGYSLEYLVCDLGEDMAKQIELLAKQHQVTVSMLMQAVWGILLQRYNNSRDVVFGNVVSGRPAEIPGIENMVGLFINTIPVRVQTGEEETFAQLLKKLQEQYLASHSYDTYPLYEIQALTGQKQSLINHVMVFENYPVEERLGQLRQDDSDEMEITVIEAFEQTNYDFVLTIEPGAQLELHMRYNALVFEAETIRRLQGHLVRLLEQVLDNPHIPVSDLDMITGQEKAQIIEVWGDTAAPYPREKTLHSIFEEKAALTPDHTALIYGETELTYGELHQQANRLARTLRAQGVRPDQPVGIMVERSLEMIIGIHAILKAGGAYVPIDPEFPEDRIRHMLEDSGAKLLLTKNHLKDRFPFAGTIVTLDDPQAYHVDASNLEPIAGPEHLAYIIYTSGSTGKPKGVMIEHRSAVHTLSQLEAEYPMLAGDRFLLKTTFTFDFSVPELFCWFFGQGTLVILPQGADKDPVTLLEAVDANRITHLNLVPSMLSVLVQYLKESGTQGFLTLKYLFACGETLPVKLVEEYYKVSPYAVLENIYGPTEAAVYATRYTTSLETVSLMHVPIGKPYANVQVWIMDSASQLSPVGVPGELCIAGEGVARGYFNQPDLTAEKFIPHPYKPGERIYRTGDLARWLPDGNIEYLGRIDHQVKIRGYRIELGEVEAQVLKVPSVQEAVVLALADATGSTQLCAYFVAEESLTAGVLREALAGELPGYMIPSAFVQLPQMPLNPNGKLDRKALPAPEALLRSTAEYIPPRTPTEVELAQIWSEVLGVEEIGVKDHFFELGGHSLKVLGLIQKISTSMGVQLPLQLVFNLPTVEELALEISKLRAKAAHEEEEMEILRFPGKGTIKLFCFPPRVGYSLGYYEMARELEEHCEVYGFEFIGDRVQGQEMLDRYVDAVIGIQAEGPYVFLGYSLGGNLAFEVAKAMESRGHHVSDLIMVDAMRETSKDESTPEQLEEIVEMVMDSIGDQYKSFLADPSDRERVKDKMLVYSIYRNELINAGEVQANIHALIAEDDTIGPVTSSDKLQWQQATLGQYEEYGVIGTHDVLLESGYVSENAKVLRQILGKITAAASKNKPILS